MRNKISENIQSIEERIARAAGRAGRAARDVKLIPVTKSVGEEEARILVGLGYTDLGENRIETARPKIDALGPGVRWHMIGHVQRRKAREVARLFDRVDSVDRLQLAEALEKHCAEAGKTLDVLLQVNVSGEESKGGFTQASIRDAIEVVRALPHLRVQGLMTMAPIVDDPEEARPLFARLRELAKGLGLAELSMGMTNDFEVAIEEGATEVRIGTAIFK
ncbi:MAG: YggS family pyridoxal phosphate-dependent enzyme [Candidatus Hydrogenedentes bacterium]|nr:YggS family pyridoxal phosphate-dependent enzyme [Candidatus Hydrogenedentota bacterium]